MPPQRKSRARPIRPEEATILRELEEEVGYSLARIRRRAPSDGSKSEVFRWRVPPERRRAYELDKGGYIVGLTFAVREQEDRSSAALRELPKAILKLKHLRNLDLRRNLIRELPSALFDIPAEVSLEWAGYVRITLGENPLRSPPPEIADRGRQAILEYYSSLHEGVQSLDEVKVILVGEGGAGKTSLVKCLVGEDFDPTEEQTHGINIRGWDSPRTEQRLKLNFWDFGGQEIMHATHQFFLSKRSLYILVLDGRREERTEHWLRLIKTFGGDSPVLVAVNKVDQNPAFDLNRGFLAEKYPAIKDFHRISCSDGTGISDLRNSVIESAKQVEIVNTKWPISWLRVKEGLEGLSDNFISYAEFDDICARAGVESAEARDTLLDYLHDLGIAIHFRDFDLEGMQVLNPVWVTTGVYKIINSVQLAMDGGRLSLRGVREILKPWEESYPPAAQRYLVELMRKFELCYRVAGSSVLVPDLLPVQEPPIHFEAGDALQIVMKYDFLPTSILPRFMVRMYEDVREGWRTGLVLADEVFGASAMVRSDREASRIDVSISGPLRREYFAVILSTFRLIHRSYEGLKCIEYVTVPGEVDVFVSYAHLLNLERLGIREFVPEGADKAYSVRALLGSVRAEVTDLDEVLRILKKLEGGADTQESLARKANEIIKLQPNFFGVGVDVNQLIRRFLARPKDAAKK